jgi:NAD(P)-dependent dehydrogenase (short-subunit alcohol dehydrogenase family)
MFNAIYESETQLNRRKRAIPMNRFASPQEMARAALFLASDDAAFMTGDTLVIDGGSLDSMYYLMGLLSSTE